MHIDGLQSKKFVEGKKQRTPPNPDRTKKIKPATAMAINYIIVTNTRPVRKSCWASESIIVKNKNCFIILIFNLITGGENIFTHTAALKRCLPAMVWSPLRHLRSQ